MALARSHAATDRETLLLTLADLCNGMAPGDDPATQRLVRDIFMGLAADAEHAIRLRLSEKLASAAWAPHDLVMALARDDIDIARPIIADSPVLTDHDLIRLVVECAIEHQIEVARRPCLAAPVVQVVVDRADPDVLAALAGNATAELSPPTLARLIGFSERMAALRAPLTRHPLLTADLAGLLYGWVGDSLRTALATRFDYDAEAFDRALAESVWDLHGDPLAAMSDAQLDLGDLDPAGGAARAGDRDAMERRVVQKLMAAGQLRPGLLIRALHEGKLALFTAALGALGGFDDETVRAAMDSTRPDRLAEACTAIGIDRGAFPTVLSLVRRLNEGRPGGEAATDGRGPGAAASAPTPSRRRADTLTRFDLERGLTRRPTRPS